jgi:DNA-binding SARP family transcriptional activator
MQFSILGRVEVRHAIDSDPVIIRQARLRALLVVFLISGNKVLTTNEIIHSLWGEGAPAGASHAVHSYISSLRPFLAPQQLRGLRPGYQLSIEPLQLDSSIFSSLSDQGKSAYRAGELTLAGDVLDLAIALWRDTALPDFPRTPAMQESASKLRDEYRTAHDLMTRSRLETGRHLELIPILRAETARDPGNERAWGQLMLALYRSEMRTEALHAFTRACKALGNAAGIDPGPSMRRLHQQILHDDPALADYAGERGSGTG